MVAKTSTKSVKAAGKAAAKATTVAKKVVKKTAKKTTTGKTAKVVKKSAAAKAPKAAAKATTAKTKVAKKAVATTVKPRKAAAGASALSGASARIDRRIQELGDWRGERLAEIRKLIHEVDPAVVEEWKWMGTPVWSHQGMYALANAHKDKVKLTFFHGARLADPDRLFNAGLGGGKWRAIDIRKGDTLDRTALKALLREAVAYNTTHAVPKSKGSRA